MANPRQCPSCGRIGGLVGPEPYVCVVCGYVVTVNEEEE